MSKNPLRDLLTGYEAASEHEVKGKRFVSKAISGTVSYEKPSKLVVKLTETARSFVNLVSYTSTRSYGLLLGVFGLLTLMLHFTNSYFSPSSDLSMPVMMLGAVFAILAIPFLSFDKPIAVAMQEFRLTDAVFFEFFCIQRMQKKTTERGLHPALCILLGLALAVLGSLFGAWYVAAGMACATYLYLTAISPEFSFFFVFLAMPYMSLVKNGEVILAVLVAVTVLSFIRKVSQGKRIYYFEQYDFLLLVMLIIVFISGIFIGGISSFVPSLVMLALGFGGYALTGSLVSNRRLADCVIKANIISSLPISFIAIAQLIRAALTGGIAEYGGSDAVFDSPDMLGAFLLISASFMLYFVFVRRHRAVKLTYAVYLLITLMAMATTMRLWLAVALFAGLVAYLVMRLKHGSRILLGILAFVPYAALFLPEATLLSIAASPVIGHLGLDGYFEVWVASRKLFVANMLSGVGTGDFMDAPYSASFLLQIALEAGILVLVVFIMIFAVRLRHRAVYSPYTKSSQVSMLANFADATPVALLVYGLFTPLWSSPAVYYLFWCVFGLGSAVLRIAKREFDDRVGYFSDGADADTSSIDISLSRT